MTKGLGGIEITEPARRTGSATYALPGNQSGLRILLSVFACLPEGRAEDCVGWNWVTQIAHHHEVWAMADKNRQHQIEAYLTSHPLANVHWIFHDIPGWLRPFSNLEPTAYIHYAAWQLGAYLRARQLHRDVHFDAVHHVTYVQYWSGSPLSRLPIPFLWGPVGGGDAAPKPFYSSFGAFGRLYETVRDFVLSVAPLNPVVRHNARTAKLVLATTEETARRLRALGAKNVRVMQTVRLSQREFDRLQDIPCRNGGPFRVFSAGRILHFKGFFMAVRSFALLLKEHPDSEYWIAGEGPDKERCQRVAETLGIQHRIHWCGQVPREQVYKLLAECDVLLHPSLHESGGYICLEAMAAGRPVVCLDLGGPGLLLSDDSGIKVPAVNPEQSVADLAKALSTLAADKELRNRLGSAARERVRQHFTWSADDPRIQELYSEFA